MLGSSTSCRHRRAPAEHRGNLLPAIDLAQALIAHLRGLPKRTILLIDESHLLPDASLEDLRLLTADDYRRSPFALEGAWYWYQNWIDHCIDLCTPAGEKYK